MDQCLSPPRGSLQVGRRGRSGSARRVLWRLDQPMDPRTFQRRSRSSRVDLRNLECVDTLRLTTKEIYVFDCCWLEVSVSSWGGGRGLRTIRAWREPCLPSSESSELHRESGTPQRRAGGTRGVNGQCLSSSLHNRFITFYRKTPAISSVSPQQMGSVRAWRRPMG